MSRVLLILCVSLTIGKSLSAQFFNQRTEFVNANRVWIFGWQAGLDFNAGPVSAFQSPLIIGEGIAISCSPATGDLQFYSDGRTVRDRWHNIMPNGTGIAGNNGSTIQGAVIVPVPGNPDQYLLFSLEYEGDPGRLYYSRIDLSLNGGMGDVVAAQKNIRLDSNLSESMIAIPGDNCDVWLVVHTRTDPVFKAYRITSGGLDITPVLSNTGSRPISGMRTSGAQAYHAFKYALMQAAPQRDRIVITSENFNYPAGVPGAPSITGVMLCRFDPARGTVSAPILVTDTSTCNVSFSPDGKLLYLTKPDPVSLASVLYQYDIRNYDSAAIAASGMYIGSISNTYSPSNFGGTRMRLYNDTIYLGNFLSETLHRINSPDLRGAACDLEINAISLAPGTTVIGGFPTDIVYTLPPDTLYMRHDTVICARQTLALTAAGNDRIRWDDGSVLRTRQISGPGSYYVVSKTDCHFSVDTFAVSFRPDDTTASVLADTIICNAGAAIQLRAPSGFSSYLWNTGDTGIILRTSDRGSFRVYSADACRVRIDSFHLGGADLQFSLGEDCFLCAGDTVSLTIPVNGTYAWQDGSSDRTFAAAGAGTYTATVSGEGCAWSDTILIRMTDAPQQLGPDSSICLGKEISLMLKASLPPGTRALWSDGSTGPEMNVTDTGVYWVKVCQSTDTIRIYSEVCTCSIIMPNAFTPNGDGMNDYFRPLVSAGCPVRQFRMNIYDRWGTRIFSTHSAVTGWNGLINGSPAEPGVYMYEVQAEAGTKAEQQYHKGDFTLIR